MSVGWQEIVTLGVLVVGVALVARAGRARGAVRVGGADGDGDDRANGDDDGDGDGDGDDAASGGARRATAGTRTLYVTWPVREKLRGDRRTELITAAEARFEALLAECGAGVLDGAHVSRDEVTVVCEVTDATAATAAIVAALRKGGELEGVVVSVQRAEDGEFEITWPAERAGERLG